MSGLPSPRFEGAKTAGSGPPARAHATELWGSRQEAWVWVRQPGGLDLWTEKSWKDQTVSVGLHDVHVTEKKTFYECDGSIAISECFSMKNERNLSSISKILMLTFFYRFTKCSPSKDSSNYPLIKHTYILRHAHTLLSPLLSMHTHTKVQC